MTIEGVDDMKKRKVKVPLVATTNISIEMEIPEDKEEWLTKYLEGIEKIKELEEEILEMRMKLLSS